MNTPPDWSPADGLGEALHLLRTRGFFYCRSELSAPWGLSMPAMAGCAWFHVLTSGRCELSGVGPSVSLGPGDFALVTRGTGHRLRSAPRVSTPVVTELPHEMETERYAWLKHGGGGAVMHLVCGVVRLEHPAIDRLLAGLPAVIHLTPGAFYSTGVMERTLRLIAAEAPRLLPGGETVITRLADILVIQALRAWLERDPQARRGWLGALRDPQLGRALAELHRDPAHDWSVSSLASAAAMSRSAFAARFASVLGETPMHYVARLRMGVAAAALREEKVSVGELSERLGYQSEAAFSRAFKRHTGLPPGAARRAGRAAQQLM